MDKIVKFLRKADAKLRRKLIEIITLIEANQLENLDIKPLKGYKNTFRCKHADIRIIFMRNAGKNIIYDIQFRGSAYKK